MGEEVNCIISGCEKPRRRKSAEYCNAHYARLRRHGDTLVNQPVTRVVKGDPITRFQSRLSGTPSGCYEWQGGKLKDGYGSFRFENKSWPAHRWIWTHVHGPIPSGSVVRHKCDNPACANIEHLELGAVADNANDMVSRGRSLVGVLNAANKLTEQQVLEIKQAIRDKSAKQKDIAARYGVTPTLITAIKQGRVWTHIAL